MGGAGSVGPDSNVEACTATRELLKNGDFESETLDVLSTASIERAAVTVTAPKVLVADGASFRRHRKTEP
jgi:hypothetical protein